MVTGGGTSRRSRHETGEIVKKCQRERGVAGLRRLQSVLPVTGPTAAVCDRDNHDSGGLDSIHDAVWKATEQEATCAVIICRPSGRRTLDRGSGYVEFVCERRGCLDASGRIPAGSFFGFGQRLVEILKRQD